MDKLEIMPRGGLKKTTDTRVAIADRVPGVHKVEFIIYSGYMICNVLIDGVWRTTTLDNNITIAEFLLAGKVGAAAVWPEGRPENNA